MKELSKNILFQYFSGTASPLQRKLILEWLEEEGNAERFYCWLEEWEKEHTQFVPASSAGAAGIMARLSSNDIFAGAQSLPTAGYSRIRSIFKIAAVLVLLLSVAWLFRKNIMYTRYETAYSVVREIRLPDSSEVVLNAHSTLLVPRWGFNNGDRNVVLSGEAVFKVKHTVTNQRFLVKTDGQLNVEVLGTEFSVSSRNNNNKVALKKGSVKVLFKQPDYAPLVMVPGDIVNLENGGKVMITHKQATNNFIAWKDHRFVFDSTTLADAANYIQEFFGNSIVVADERLKEKRITGSFRADSSTEVLSILSEMYNMTMQRNGNHIILTNKMKH